LVYSLFVIENAWSKKKKPPPKKGVCKGKGMRGAHRFMEEFDCRQNIASIVI